QIHPTSFLLGLGAALVVPLFTRVLRPLAVEAAVAGMAIVEEGRRPAAEQKETFEDIVARGRARRRGAPSPQAQRAPGGAAPAVGSAGDEADRAGARRRSNGGRRRAS